MNFLDRAIGFVRPASALRRARQRAAIAMLTRSYEGARAGRRTEGWTVAGASANAEIGGALPRLRDRTRDLVRNNPYAAKAVQAVVSNLVGTGILPRARSGDTGVNEQADRLWTRFAEGCDADGLTDFSGLQALIVRAMVESGECLLRFRERRIADGLAVPLQLQLLEPDHLDTSKTGVCQAAASSSRASSSIRWAEGAPTGCSRCIPARSRCSAARRSPASRCRRHRCYTCSIGCGRARCVAYPGSRR